MLARRESDRSGLGVRDIRVNTTGKLSKSVLQISFENLGVERIEESILSKGFLGYRTGRPEVPSKGGRHGDVGTGQTSEHDDGFDKNKGGEKTRVNQGEVDACLQISVIA